MIKAAFVLGYLGEKFGGPPKMAINLGRALSRYGVEATWWATASDEERRELTYLGGAAHLFGGAFPRSWYRSRDLRKELERFRESIDLLHLNQIWDYPILAGARMAIRTHKPFLITPHGIFAQPWRYGGVKKGLYLRLMALPFLNRATCVHAVAKQELRGFEEVGIKVPYTIIPNGVDPDEFSDLPSEQIAHRMWPNLGPGPLVLYMGRLSYEKGLDKLVPAWKSVRREFPNSQLMLAGPDFGNYRTVLEPMIRREGLEGSIHMPGFITGIQKKALLGLADVYVQPSLSEAFSISVLEALCCGKPCIITTGCDFLEVAQAGAGEIVASDAEAIGAALLRFLRMPDQERQERGRRGRALVMENYTWDIAARKMLTVYRCILKKKPIPLYPEPAL